MGAELDATDWRILKELQADGRITNVALAARVGLSPPPCLRRVRTLEEAGFIRGYHAELDARLAGYEITAFASVRLHAQGEPELREFEKQVLMWPLVREVYMLSGDMDYQLTCVAPDLSAFQEQVVGKLSALPNVASVKTTLVMRRVKHDPGVPIAIPEA
ncbi:MAG: Lrp/AsnC family transcriptional regulator [Hyphomicrobiaceae bacterium]